MTGSDPVAYLSPQPNGRVQVVSGGCSVAQFFSAEDAVAYLAKHWPGVTPQEWRDGAFCPVGAL